METQPIYFCQFIFYEHIIIKTFMLTDQNQNDENITTKLDKSTPVLYMPVILLLATYKMYL